MTTDQNEGGGELIDLNHGPWTGDELRAWAEATAQHIESGRVQIWVDVVIHDRAHREFTLRALYPEHL